MPGVGESIVIVMILGLVVLWGIALVDCATKETGSARLLWLAAIVVGNVGGALIYLVWRRGRRKKLAEM